ncbi:MAG: roadblock/LC7 domain-containing protein [Candidatus Methanoperedens sp.]|nr:roadblock/LC7 domain-containing protein [Candidatus Methanoperedens sp.]
MPTKADLYLNTLSELENSTGDIISTAIVTHDGLIMACTRQDREKNEIFAAYGAATFKRAGETMEALSGENIDMLLYESKDHMVVTVRAGEHALIIALTGKNVQMGFVIMNVQKTAQKIKEI